LYIDETFEFRIFVSG